MNAIKPPYSVGEEIANAVSHGLGALLGVAALTLLINNAYASADITKMISFIIYGSSLILLFLASTLYHAITNQAIKKVFKLLDHCAIYFLIAGTYTPLLLVTLQGSLGLWMFSLIWSIALGGVFFKIKFGHQYKALSLITYLGMGAISFTILHKLQLALNEQAIYLLSIGGLAYFLGVFFYIQKKIPYSHAVWHLFVLAGATCHFFMIYLYV